MPFLYLSHHVHAQDRLMIVSCLSLLFSCNYSTTTICWWRWATVSAVESCYSIITSVISFYRFGGLWWSEDEYEYETSACKHFSCRAPPPSRLVLFTGLENNASQSERERRGIFHRIKGYGTIQCGEYSCWVIIKHFINLALLAYVLYVTSIQHFLPRVNYNLRIDRRRLPLVAGAVIKI